MGFTELPPELVEQILSSCDLRQILRCKSVCKSFNILINDSALLTYYIDLAISGFDDHNLAPTHNLLERRALLSAAQETWRGTNSMALLETLHVTDLEYWPIRDSVLLRKINVPRVEGENAEHVVAFDVSQITSRLHPADVLSHWQVRLPRGTGSIACIDATQDLLVVRYHAPPLPNSDPDYLAAQRYRLAIHSLRTGRPHPRAKHAQIEFTMSQRVVKNPHYTRVQVLDNILAVNMASGFQLFTETTFFDWVTGEQKAVFCSPGTSARAWGHPAVLVSDTCFLQPCYSAAERRPAIEVYVLDDTIPLDEDGHRPARHVATYGLPRVLSGDVRLIINVTSRQQLSADGADGGFLLSSSYARMIHVQVTGVWFTSPFKCAFFTPAHQFIDESNRFFSTPAPQRSWAGPRFRPWATWGNTSTRWLETDGPVWHEEAKSSLRGSGSRYAFPNYLIDFAPMDVAREVGQYKQHSGYDTRMFPSTRVSGWTTHCHVATKAQISGADMFDEDVVSSLPYREKEISELPDFEPGSDVLLVNDKIVTIQGGVLDTIKIYVPTTVTAPAETPDESVDELTAALNAVTLGN